MGADLDSETWYQCDRCTACCKWPGDVKVEDEEVTAIAKFLEMDEDAFIQRFTRLRMNRNGLSLIERDNDECIMLENDRCLIQEVKPFQCKGFPNRWNFKDWEKVCQAKPVPMAQALKMGLVEEGDLSANHAARGSEL